jgi:hypothetical protein
MFDSFQLEHFLGLLSALRWDQEVPRNLGNHLPIYTALTSQKSEAQKNKEHEGNDKRINLDLKF